uniref:ALMS motif domain-containing protein n=1 Tax=Varanus komodoensis TaxID=61221 RepID=A0A8D2LVD5_VARKO
MSEAVRLAGTEVGSDSSSDRFSLSQHPLAFSIVTPGSTSLGSCLSQHPLSLSGHIAKDQQHYVEEQTTHLAIDAKTLGSTDENSGVLGSRKLLNWQEAMPLPPKESQGIASGQDLFLLDSNVPAPLLLEMLEKEVGVSEHCGFSSSTSSSCKSMVGNDQEENVMSQLVEKVVQVEKEPETSVEPHQQECRSIPQPDSLKLLSDPEGRPFKIARNSQVLVSSKGQRMALGDACAITGISPSPLLKKPQMQHISETIFEEQKGQIVSVPADCRPNAPAALQPVIVTPEHGDKCSKQVDNVIEIRTGESKNELTLSDVSIEREHKDTGVSPSFDERSFVGYLAHPIHHSTPGIFLTRSLKQEGPGKAFPVTSLLQASLSCLPEEILKNSCVTTSIPSVEGPRVMSLDDTPIPSAEEPLTLQSEQEEKLENSDGLRDLHLLESRIQTLPSLSFMEKVGAWNVSHSAERMSDALTSHGSSDTSPRQKAYSAVADSLNRMLLKQQSQAALKGGVGASVSGPNPQGNMQSCNEEPLHALPLTQSQSENSVIAITREIPRAEVGHETAPGDDLQAANDSDSNSGASAVKQSAANIDNSLAPRYTAVLVSTLSSDEETIGSVDRGRSSNPDQLITSERVAELLRNEASLLSDSRDKYGSQDNTKEVPGIHLCTSQIGMDRFGDVSPDSLNQMINSRAGSCADLRLSSRQSSRRSSLVSGKLHSSSEDGLQTPDDREINIEARIPVYLRNLGIDQSPTSILSPFMPQGPIREIELSPTEPGTLKASVGSSTQRSQLSEGDSHLVVDAMQSSVNSSTLSVPAAAGSDTGPGVPLPSECSQQPSSNPLSQCSRVCRQLELCTPTPHSLEGSAQAQAVAPAPAPPSAEQHQVTSANFHSGGDGSTECARILIGRLDSVDCVGSQEKLSSSSVSQEKDEKGVSEEINSSRVIPEGEKDNSIIGSRTLKEIQMLLEENESITPGGNCSSSSSSSSTDQDSSFKQMAKVDGSGDPGSFRGSSPRVQRMWSWDETLTRQNVHEDSGLTKALSFTGKWEGLLAMNVCSSEPVSLEELRPASQMTGEGQRMGRAVRRSEPEGCHSAAVSKNLPVLVNTAIDRELRPTKECKEFQASASVAPLDSVSDILGSFQQVLKKTMEPGSKETCSSCDSENSSGVDSLSIKVKRLLQREWPAVHARGRAEEEERGACGRELLSAGATVPACKGDSGPPASDGGSSSSDSLAARVKTLLEDESPVVHAPRILQRAEEEEENAHAWVKQKEAAQPINSLLDLNEEDRKLIEEIKRGQLLTARKIRVLKEQLRASGYERIPSHSPVPKIDTGLSSIPSSNELQKAIQAQGCQVVEFPEVNAIQTRPESGADSTLPSNSEIKPLNSVQRHTCSTPQTESDNLLGSRDGSCVPLCDSTGAHLMGLTDASEPVIAEEGSVSAQAKRTVGNSPMEAAKQITSITFASRKRSSSPSRVPCADILEAAPHDLVALEIHSASSEKPKPSQQQQQSEKPLALTSPAAICLPDKSVEFSPDGECHQQVTIVVSKNESHQEKGLASGEKAQACIEQNVHLITEKLEETQTSSQVFTRLRSYDKPLEEVYNNKSNPKTIMTDQLITVNRAVQITDLACFQDGMESSDSIPEPLFPKGEESVLTQENTFTSDSYLCRVREMDTGSSSLLSSSSDHILTTMPGSPSTTRKALSGVHITLSPKLIDLDLSSPMDATAEMRQVVGFRTSSPPATITAPTPSLGTASKLESAEVPPKTQDSSYFPRAPSSTDSHFRESHAPSETKQTLYQSQELRGSRQNLSATNLGSAEVLASGGQCLEDNSKTTAASQTERMSSDAITQITMESPEKTTYSAEIFVSADNGDALSLRQRSSGLLSTTMPAVKQVSILTREDGTLLLLPYKSPQSPEVYYLPCPKEVLRLSRVRSETTMESSHSGSNDAVPPTFPAHVLGSGNEIPPDAIAIKHKEGIYSKRAALTDAWTEEKVATQKGVKENAKIRNPLESVKTVHSVLRPAQFYLHHPVALQHEIDFLPGDEALGQCARKELPVLSSEDVSHCRGIPERNHQPKAEEQLSPLTAQLNYSFVEELRFSKTLERDFLRQEVAQQDGRRASHEMVKELPSPSSQRIHLKEKPEANFSLSQNAYFTSGLDELWSKYLERQKQHQHRNPGSSRNELSLVERLDRLARLLQNPVRNALVPAADEQSSVQAAPKRSEPRKINTQGRMTHRSNCTFQNTVGKVEESPNTVRKAQPSKARHHKIQKAVDQMGGRLEQHQDSDTLSCISSGLRNVKDSSVFTGLTSESEGTLPETESATQTEASSSVSTINTARLIRAFGHDRVQVSPKLSQLYSAISVQKTRSEKWAKGSRKDQGARPSKTARVEQEGKDAQATDSFVSSDSTSTMSSSRGPSSALSNKRSARMLNKAVQAGDFEIVNSATKKHTRDVGLTFPTPMCSRTRLQGDSRSGTADECAQPEGLASARVSWFVPTEDLKFHPKKRSGSSFIPDPGPSWFEPLSSRKPWREPLREKNWQEDHGGLQVRLAASARDIENKPPPPFVKMTLQEALALHRPDFISSSGERVKRLKLIIEERKLQSVLQGEREELFNPPEERRSYRNASCLLPNRDYRTIRRRRAIPKNEMFQRSKRIYEQLPEVRKRREEEKRKSDYSTNRLKAQLYKMKITNRILGRKVPWE